MRRSSLLMTVLVLGLLVPPLVLADAGFHVVDLTHPAYFPSANAWTTPPCEQVRERYTYLPVTWPTTSTPSAGPAYPLHGDGVVSGYVQNFYYYTRNHSVNDLPFPACISSPPTRDVEVAMNSSYVGWVTVPPGPAVTVTFAWQAETVLVWALANAAPITGSCGVFVGGVPVPATFNAATATCSATVAFATSTDFFLHGGATAATTLTAPPTTGAFHSTLRLDVSGVVPHHFEYSSTY